MVSIDDTHLAALLILRGSPQDKLVLPPGTLSTDFRDPKAPKIFTPHINDNLEHEHERPQ